MAQRGQLRTERIYERTRGQIASEIYAIISGEDIRIFKRVIDKNFPKAKGCLDRMTLEQLSDLLPLLKTAYSDNLLKREEVTELKP